MERFNAKHSGVHTRVQLQKFRQRASGNIAAARESEMRMPWSKFGLDSNLKRCFLDAFVKLEQMRMRRTNPDPNNFHDSLRWKSSYAFDRQKKRAELDRCQFFAQCKIDILRNVREKAEGEMELIPSGPVNAAKVWIQINEDLSDRLRRIDRNEKPFHLPPRISPPVFGSLPLWLTCGGKEPLNILIARAIKFGSSAFAAMIR